MKNICKKNWIIIYFIIVIFFVLDRWLKYLFLRNPDIRQDFSFVTFHIAKNNGIAFGLDFYFPLLIFCIVAALIFFMVKLFRAHKDKSSISIASMSMVIFGTLSNFYDRIIYRYVIDYIDVPHFTVINIADIMISLGIAVFIFKEIFPLKKIKL